MAPIFQGFGDDGISVVRVEDEEVFIAFAGQRWEGTGLVGVDFASFLDGDEGHVCFETMIRFGE